MSTRRLLAAIAALGLGTAPASSQTQALAIVGGKIVDGTERAPIENGVVLVDGNEIRAVGSRSQVPIPEGARVIDASGASVLPGLADLHIHATHFIASPRAFEDDAMSALRAAAVLRQALDSGITLVRDAGARNYTATALKRALAQGYIEGPRLVICNQIVGVTGGHGTEGDLMETPKWLRESDSPYEWRKNIRQNFKMGADYVKVTPPFTRDEIQLAAEEAHNFGARIAVDAAGQAYPGMMMVEHAVAAGADTIEHLAPMKNTDQVIAMMKEHGTIVVPTLHATRRFAGERWDRPTERDARELTRPEDYELRFRKMHAAGIPMAIGTDTGGKDQGEIGAFYAQEIDRWMAWGYGAHEVIRAATRVGAEAAGLDDRLGTLEPGKWADIIVVEGDVLMAPASIVRPNWVVFDGKIVRRPRDETSEASTSHGSK
jgi:imidazolonepropionase-like amidohydrolase